MRHDSGEVVFEEAVLAESKRTTVLCLASYEKGADLMREAKRQGARVLLVTADKLAAAAWPRDAIDELYLMPDPSRRGDVLNAVSWLARTEHIDRIVALDEFDLEMAALLREHLRIPGMGETAVRAFRDKLVMREKASAAGVPVPAFTPIVNHARVAEWLRRVPPPWVLKPRTQASAIGIRKLAAEEEVWRAANDLGDDQSHYLLEAFVPGEVLHVDGIVWQGRVVFEECHRYHAPPFEVMHGGGIFCSQTVEHGSLLATEMKDANRAIVHALGLERGAFHTELIRGTDGRISFLECAARVGGASIAEMVEAAAGVNLWREWAKVEVADVEGRGYTPPDARTDYAAVLITLARQERPDTSGYTDPEVVWRLDRPHHAGLILASSDAHRLEALVEEYLRRFMAEFHASLPAPDRPTA